MDQLNSQSATCRACGADHLLMYGEEDDCGQIFELLKCTAPAIWIGWLVETIRFY